jgi:hypothetical protein
MTGRIIRQRIIGKILTKALMGSCLASSLGRQEALAENVQKIVRSNGSIIIFLNSENLNLSPEEIAAIEDFCHPCGGTGKNYPLWLIPFISRKISRKCKFCQGTGVWNKDLRDL